MELKSCPIWTPVPNIGRVNLTFGVLWSIFHRSVLYDFAERDSNMENIIFCQPTDLFGLPDLKLSLYCEYTLSYSMHSACLMMCCLGAWEDAFLNLP